jgi:hypothetical protein
MNRIFKSFLFVIEFVMCYLILSGQLLTECVIKQVFHIACPACGFTRGFRAILSGNLLKAIQYNLLSIPVFIFFIIVNGYLIYDIIKDKKKTDFFFGKLGKFIIPILIILFLNMVMNNVRGI